MTHHLIIGNGVAGMTAAETIRKEDSEAKITMVSKESEPFYYRPRFPSFIQGATKKDDLFIRSLEDYDAMRIDLIFGQKVTAVNPEKNTVEIKNGSTIVYDNLLIATGSWPHKLKVPGADLDGVVTLRTLADAEKIAGRLTDVKSAVVIGGGLTGVEMVKTFRNLGLSVTYLLRGKRFWPKMLDEEASSIIESRIIANGVEMIKNTEVVEVIGSEGKTTAVITSMGQQVPCDILAVAIGVSPNIEFLRGSSIETEKGILINEQMRTNHPNIYAAGDVAQAYDIVYKEYLVHTAWPIAMKQGEIAGSNMAGRVRKYLGGIPSNTIKAYGVDVTTMGITTPENIKDFDEIVTMSIPDMQIYKKYVLRDDIFIGATFITDNAEGEIAEALISERVDMSKIKGQLKDPGFTFEPYLQTNLKIVCPVCNAELPLPLGTKDGDTLICPVCKAKLILKEQNGLLVVGEAIESQ